MVSSCGFLMSEGRLDCIFLFMCFQLSVTDYQQRENFFFRGHAEFYHLSHMMLSNLFWQFKPECFSHFWILICWAGWRKQDRLWLIAFIVVVVPFSIFMFLIIIFHRVRKSRNISIFLMPQACCYYSCL